MKTKQKNIIFIFLSILIFTGCFNVKSNEKFENLFLIPDSVHIFFPEKTKELRNMRLIYSSSNADKSEYRYEARSFNPLYIARVFEILNETERHNIIFELSHNVKTKVKSDGNDYFIIDSQKFMYILCDSAKLIEKYNIFSNNIVLSFNNTFESNYFLKNSKTLSGLPPGYQIITIKSGNDFILPADYKFDWAILPNQIKHGYRSGIAFKEDEPYLIYWVVAW